MNLLSETKLLQGIFVKVLIGVILLTCLWDSHLLAAGEEKLEAGFMAPPSSARPCVWWHWMNGNITKEGITADLEAMQAVGLGGALIFNVECLIPAGPVKYMSQEWRELLKHAVKESDRLGLELSFHNGAGWSSSGGPWVKPEEAAQKVVYSEQSVKGPTRFSGVLPQPKTAGNIADRGSGRNKIRRRRNDS